MSQKEVNKDNSTNSPSASRNISESVAKGQEQSGIILGPDGKPCRACTDFKSWAKQMKGDVVGRSMPAMASAVRLVNFLILFDLVFLGS